MSDIDSMRQSRQTRRSRPKNMSDTNSCKNETCAAKPEEEILREYKVLKQMFPNPECPLKYSNPFELLIAAMLSAQTTDKRVNLVAEKLFRMYPDAYSMSKADVSDIAECIYSLGFWRMKAARCIDISQQLVSRFSGRVPNTLEELAGLPGVGRKTANVVLGNAFGIPGFPVDTHVIRVTGRLRWRARKPRKNDDENAVRIEKELTCVFKPEEWAAASHRIILFGRNVCEARNPKCESCALKACCPHFLRGSD